MMTLQSATASSSRPPKQIHYRAGYKYQLAWDYTEYLPKAKGWPEVNTAFMKVTHVVGGGVMLLIRAGYAWDGPSGPTFDTPNFMRGSLVHDAIYQLIREGRLMPTERKYADQVLRAMCREDGMNALRAWWVYEGVRKTGVITNV